MSERVRATPSMTTQYTNRSIHQNRQIIHSLKAVLWSLCPPAPKRALDFPHPQPTSPVANLMRNVLNTPILVLTTEIVAAQSALHSNAPAAWCPSCDPSAADIAR
ncbi:hypothetical protein B0H14DRAFT_3466341 [Mycena olivaceomarginata]|nr:hypothetical protein B0H14DRAFT_3466341 [Mycena olivaceomarginata]